MQLPYTLDLNPWVNHNPNLERGESNDDLKWLNEQQPHEGYYYFFLSYSQSVINKHMSQVFAIKQGIFEQNPHPRNLVEKTLEASNSEKNKDTFNKLYDYGARPLDFYNDTLLLPQHVVVNFETKEILINPTLFNPNKQQFNPELPYKASFDKTGNLSEAYFYSHNKDKPKRAIYDANGHCISIHDYAEDSVFEEITVDEDRNLKDFKFNNTDIINTLSGSLDQKFKQLVETEYVPIQKEAEQIWQNYKVKFDF